MSSTYTLTLAQLADSARTMGFPAEVTSTGGNVRALALTVNGAHARVSLDGGQEDGTAWAVSLDGATRETHGEQDTGDCPVTSDADQTVTDAVAWVRWAVWGEPLAD